MVNPYRRLTDEASNVMSFLIKLMCEAQDIKFFKNVAAVYVAWQHEGHALQVAAMEWESNNG